MKFTGRTRGIIILVMLNEISMDPKDLIECNSGHNWWDLTLGHWPSPCFFLREHIYICLVMYCTGLAAFG